MIKTHLFLLLSFVTVLAACKGGKNLKAKQANEGKIIFELSYDNLPPEMEAFESMLPKENELVFKDSLYRQTQQIPMAGKQIVLRTKDRKEPVVLMDMMGRKMLMEAPEGASKAGESTVELFKDEKTIAGFVCNRASVRMSDQDNPINLWYCPAIVNSMANFDVPGMPLEFDIEQMEMLIKLSAKSVTLEAQSPDNFVIPEGYEPISEEELNNLFPGM